MALLLVLLGVLVLALGLAQAWTIWFLKREVARLEFRLGEALDDEDLLEFQDRLKALLAEAKKTAEALARAAETRKAELEQALERARLAEKSLALRLLAKSASDAGRKRYAPPVKAPKAGKTVRSSAAPPDPSGSRPGKGAEAAAKGPERPAMGLALPRRDEAPADAGDARDERRSYLARPKDGAAPRHQAIYDLADQGLDVEAIAKRAGLLAGEVDLILSLRRRGPAA